MHTFRLYLPLDEKSLHMKYPLILVIICAKYEKNPPKTANVTEHIQ